MSFLYPYLCHRYCSVMTSVNGGASSSHFAIYGGNVLSTGVKELISVHKSKPVDNTFVRVANSKLFSAATRTKTIVCQ